LLQTAQQHRRFSPAGELQVNTPAGPQSVSLACRGFPWRPADFNQVVVVGPYDVAALSHHYASPGVGVPVVVCRRRSRDERFLDNLHQFAATAVLRFPCREGCPDVRAAMLPGPEMLPEAMPSAGPVLEFHDPLRVSTVEMCGRVMPLAGDRTAPFAFLLSKRKRSYVERFLQPGLSSGQAQLIMFEPYQPGKIPLVFVHGLLSDPLTWVHMANEIRARDDLMARYQIWVFRYPTGEPFLRSAASLRRELCAAVAVVDPQHRDPALSQMVLVGHSMGGLISKLQVASSGNTLWNSVANRPLDQIVATPKQREELRQYFFFEPVPYVRQVVFMATPHRGSAWANRLVGRFGATLVRMSEGRQRDHEMLIHNNPDTFIREIRRGIPTSIDMLEPDSVVLRATQRLCISPAVSLHSIIGNGRPEPFEGGSDGVVTVASAQLDGVASQRFIKTDHSGVHNHPEAVCEVVWILREHRAPCEPGPVIAVPESLPGEAPSLPEIYGQTSSAGPSTTAAPETAASRRIHTISTSSTRPPSAR
jgi:hypothetical protein